MAKLKTIELNLSFIIYDGICNVCSSLVKILLKKLNRNEFKFIPYQTDEYRILREDYPQLPLEPESIIFIKSGEIFLKSAAVLEISRQLKFPYNLPKFLSFIPVKQMDVIYDYLADRRYSIFGKRKVCYLPDSK